MKLIFIRHGEPDYNTDSLTENGIQEAIALSKRVKNWEVTNFYVSPLGRAKETASYSLKAVEREAIILPFMREFSYPVIAPVSNAQSVPWDFIPSSWTEYDYMFKLEKGFLEYPCIKENKEIAIKYDEAINGFDNLLKEYGYIRQGRYYKNLNAVERFLTSTVSKENKVQNNSPYRNGEKEPTLVFFCHLGITCVILSHLLNIPFETIAHGFFMPTTSLTVVSTEERWGDEVSFRVQALGDCYHLKDSNICISPAGSFAGPFNG